MALDDTVVGMVALEYIAVVMYSTVVVIVALKYTVIVMVTLEYTVVMFSKLKALKYTVLGMFLYRLLQSTPWEQVFFYRWLLSTHMW